MTMTSKVDKYIDQVHHLLPSPRVIPRLMQVVNDPNADTSEIISLIYDDPSLTANVLRISNSSYYGTGRNIDSVDEAVLRIGCREVYRIVVAISASMTLSSRNKTTGREDFELLAHSAAAATAAQLLEHSLGGDANLAFTAALLHDIGKIVLTSISEDFYRFANTAKPTESDLLEAEKRILEIDHEEVGGRLLERWKFPENLIAAVRYHHHPIEAKNHTRLAATLSLANAIAYNVGAGYGHQQSNPVLIEEAAKIIDFPLIDLPDYSERVASKLEAEKHLFSKPATAAVR